MTQVPMTALHFRLTEGDDDLLVLLHGLGTTGDIWSPFVGAAPQHWTGRILVVDLPGHGASGRLARYDMRSVVSNVAAVIDKSRSASGSLKILGHSYGGAVALELANAGAGAGLRGPSLDFIYGLGIKSVWTQEQVAGIHRLAQKAPKVFDQKETAESWYKKVAGLAALGETADACLARGVMAIEEGQWCLSQDPAVNAITPPDMSALTRNLQGSYALAYGEEDAMVDAGNLATLDPGVRSIAGGGHNVMVNNPGAVWAWLGD
jgi:pimeloyl-ACP methyl ester carboxylesterase